MFSKQSIALCLVAIGKFKLVVYTNHLFQINDLFNQVFSNVLSFGLRNGNF